MIVDELVVRITADTEQLRRGIEQARRGVEGLGRAGQSALRMRARLEEMAPLTGSAPVEVQHAGSPLAASTRDMLARQLDVMGRIEENTRELALLRDVVALLQHRASYEDADIAKGVLAYGRRGESAGLSYELSL